VHDDESASELNPLTRWQIGGSGGGVDVDTPPQPVFGLNPASQGTVELLGVGFLTLTNTRTIEAGTLGLFYWDELSSPTTFSLASAAATADTTIALNAAGPASVGDLVQIETEILEVTGVAGGGAQYQVARGGYGSTAASHNAATLLYHLRRSIIIVPFVRGFFGSPASGAFAYSIFLPDTRIGAAELFMTNAVGGGLVAKAAFGATVDQGLRTLAGGQLSLQAQGYLAIRTGATPPLVLEDSHVARDMFAVVREPPAGGPIQLQLRQNNLVYCTLTIADGQTISNVVNGFGLAPLAANARLELDITSVPTAANTLPGRDLTVTIRL